MTEALGIELHTSNSARMPLENYFSGKGARSYLHSMAACLSSVGNETFNSNFLELIEKNIKADQCMVFSFKGKRPECYVSFSRRQKKAAVNLAQKYLRDGFREDPLVPLIKEVQNSGETRIVNLSDLKSGMSKSYFEAFFTPCQIGDKISVIASKKGETVLLNFYRLKKTVCSALVMKR